MIRNNKHLKPRFDFQDNSLISYRNAVYQGQYNNQRQERQGRGIIYLTHNHHFIACNNFHNSQIQDQALFFLSHSRYHYGYWLHNQPHGLCVFRMNEILIFTQYKRGELKVGSNLLFIFEKYSQGIIIEMEEGNRWAIRSKSEVFTFEQLQSMLSECKFDSSKLSPSLVKFLNKQLISNIPHSFKLRLINNQYRYGFDHGLAIFFDDQYQLSSVGCHQKNNLCDVGIKYGLSQTGSMVEEGIFDGANTFVYQNGNKPTQSIGQMYSRYHLSSINFKNQIVNDPSEQYFRYFQSLMNQKIFKTTFNQLIINSSLHNENISFGRTTDNQDDKYSSRKYEKLEFEQLQIPKFKKTYKESSKRRIMDSEQTSRVNQDRRLLSNLQSSFEKKSEKNRLQIMKKQLYNNNNVNSRQFPAKLVNSKSNLDEEEIEELRSNQNIKESKSSRSKASSISSRKQLDKKMNLQQKIDIIIRQPPLEQTPPKSRIKKKIFENGKSIRRDYSPQTQVSPFRSPFKSKMKARIFDGSFSRSRSKSNKKIFTEQQRKKSKSPIRYKQNDQFLSPNLQMGSLQKSSSESQFANFPITMARETVPKHNSKQSEKIEQQDSRNTRLIRQSKTNLKQLFKNGEEDYPNMKKDNNIYRNPIIKGGYNQYVYEPISIKQGNKPYIKNASLKSLSRNKSNHQIIESSNATNSKKQIAQSSPLKKIKMGSYLNHESENMPNEKYSNYKKRTGYF